MTANRSAFPDDRDRAIQACAENLCGFADELTEWIGRYGSPRKNSDFEIKEIDEFQLLYLRRLATNLKNSAFVPVAAAVYGPSQVGKSLFMGRVLKPSSPIDSPLGLCHLMSPDAYIRNLSFEHDINPQSGSNEATALVTRFTTKDRFDETAIAEYPVKVRALTRSEWMRVLARGFMSECPPSTTTWFEDNMRKLFESISQSQGAETGSRDWQMDLVDTYSYMRKIDGRQFAVEEALFNSFLSRYPLSEAGYVELAGKLFWDSSGEGNGDVRGRITQLFNDVRGFIKQVRNEGKDGILIHWGAAKFLLDSQRAMEQKSKSSLWKNEIRWKDFSSATKEGWYVLEFSPGGRGPSEDLSIIQAAMLEMIIPIVPERLNGEWREVVAKMDVLDLPGMVSGGGDSKEGRGNRAENTEQKMMIVKRGKVFYLIERYIEERQVQTLLMLMRGGNQSTRALLKEYVDKWGKTRYGENNWPRRAQASDAALFIGMTGIDDEFRTRADVDKQLYHTRLNNIVEHTLQDTMKHFGGEGRRMTNVFPIRYPGTWDTDAAQRAVAEGGAAKWDEAKKIFLGTQMVQEYVRDAARRWDAAMDDNDGGMSLICDGFLRCTSSVQKQESLEQQLRETEESIKNLGRNWFVDPNSNIDREKRQTLGNRVVEWLQDEQLVYERTYLLENSLCFSEFEVAKLAEGTDRRTNRNRIETIDEQFSKLLGDFLDEWVAVTAPKKWQENTTQYKLDGTLLSTEDFSFLVKYLVDYFRVETIFHSLRERLLRILKLSIDDKNARVHVLREYMQLVLNDFIMNPGPSVGPLDPEANLGDRYFGLKQPFVLRWKQRLPLALASGAGGHKAIPQGNDELKLILDHS